MNKEPVQLEFDFYTTPQQLEFDFGEEFNIKDPCWWKYGHESHCNILHPAAPCVCDCRASRK